MFYILLYSMKYLTIHFFNGNILMKPNDWCCKKALVIKEVDTSVSGKKQETRGFHNMKVLKERISHFISEQPLAALQ